MRVDFGNVQGSIVEVIRRPRVRFLIFQFPDPAGARAFAGDLLPRVTTATEVATASDPILNVGLTSGGLRALGLDGALLGRFDAVFNEGPDARRLGDARGSSSDPARWWEEQFVTDAIHCIVQLFAGEPDDLDRGTAEIRELARQAGVQELKPRRGGGTLDAKSLGGKRLHFGYVDGISQPQVAWDDADSTPDHVDFRHFVLGYSTPECSSAPERGPAADLARDSAYGAFRWIRQDVAAFHRFLATHAPGVFPSMPAAAAQELLAAKLMGRWRDGTPLVLSPDKPDPDLTARNDFLYRDNDPDGLRCPFSSHMRVVNPRDQPLDPIVEAEVPRVLRRGVPYGPPMEGEDDDGVDRGLYGIFVCSDIRRQLYTLTGWIRQNDFSPSFNANRRVQDAIVGNRSVPGTVAEFRLPRPDGLVRVQGLPDFVQTKGTVFLLYPSRRMLETLARPA